MSDYLLELTNTELVRYLKKADHNAHMGFGGDWTSIYAVAADRIEADKALIQEMREALQHVEDWWLQDEMKNHNGAPYAIFATRAALSKAKSQQEGETE